MNEGFLAKGTNHVLIVDDDPMLLDVVRRMLMKLDYEVTACQSGGEALRMIEESRPGFDLVLTDQSMPGMTGVQLAAEIHRIHPGLPVVLVTGYGEIMAGAVESPVGVRDVITKPMTLGHLGDTLRRVLSQTASGSISG